MSYSTLELSKSFLSNQMGHGNILCLDVKTSGELPIKNKFATQENKYHDYAYCNYYDKCRVVQINYFELSTCYFDREGISYTNIVPVSVLVESSTVVISNEATKLHDMSNYHIKNNPMSVPHICNVLQRLDRVFQSCTAIVGHNIFGHLMPLMSELFRAGLFRSVERLELLIKQRRILCIGTIASINFVPKNWIPNSEWDIPSLNDILETEQHLCNYNINYLKNNVSKIVYFIENIIKNNFKQNLRTTHTLHSNQTSNLTTTFDSIKQYLKQQFENLNTNNNNQSNLDNPTLLQILSLLTNIDKKLDILIHNQTDDILTKIAFE